MEELVSSDKCCLDLNNIENNTVSKLTMHDTSLSLIKLEVIDTDYADEDTIVGQFGQNGLQETMVKIKEEFLDSDEITIEYYQFTDETIDTASEGEDELLGKTIEYKPKNELLRNTNPGRLFHVSKGIQQQTDEVKENLNKCIFYSWHLKNHEVKNHTEKNSREKTLTRHSSNCVSSQQHLKTAGTNPPHDGSSTCKITEKGSSSKIYLGTKPKPIKCSCSMCKEYARMSGIVEQDHDYLEQVHDYLDQDHNDLDEEPDYRRQEHDFQDEDHDCQGHDYQNQFDQGEDHGYQGPQDHVYQCQVPDHDDQDRVDQGNNNDYQDRGDQGHYNQNTMLMKYHDGDLKPPTCSFSNKNNKCSICHQFARSFYVQCHMASVHNCQQPLICSICFRKSKLYQHATIVYGNETKPHKCFICKKLFSLVRNLCKHLNDVHNYNEGLSSRKSIICNETFALSASLKKHVVSKHPGPEHKPHKCIICNKTFAFKHLLKYHFTSKHGREKTYKCSFCAKKFSLSASLKKHLVLKHIG